MVNTAAGKADNGVKNFKARAVAKPEFCMPTSIVTVLVVVQSKRSKQQQRKEMKRAKPLWVTTAKKTVKPTCAMLSALMATIIAIAKIITPMAINGKRG